MDIVTAKISGYDGEAITLLPSIPLDNDLLVKQPDYIEIRLHDGRSISAEQRKRIFATIRDIAKWSGEEPEYLRSMLTWDYCMTAECDYFSLSTTDMTTAYHFTNYLLEFCIKWGVPLSEPPTKRTDDIDKFLYCCIKYRKCCICGRHADIHHITGSRIGMGNDRNEVLQVGREAVALCREHHTACHNNEVKLLGKYKVYGIKLDEYLVKRLNL